MSKKHPFITETIGRTPLVALQRIGRDTGATILVKVGHLDVA